MLKTLIKSLLSLFLMTITFLLVSYQYTFGQDYIEIVNEYANLRAGPGTNYKRVGRVLRGERYELIGGTSNWLNIILKDGRSVWVIQDLAKFVEGGQEIPKEKTVLDESIKGLEQKVDQLEEDLKRFKQIMIDDDDLELKLEVEGEEGEKGEEGRKWTERIHGGFEVELFSPATVLNNLYGNGFAFGGFISYEIIYNLEPRLDFHYFSRPVKDKNGRKTDLTLIPIDLSVIYNLNNAGFLKGFFGLGLEYVLLQLHPAPPELLNESGEEKNINKGVFGYNIVVGGKVAVYKRISAFIEVRYRAANTEINYNNIDVGGFGLGIGVVY